MSPYTGDALSPSVGGVDEADRDRDHGAPQRRASGYDSSEETPAPIPAGQRTDRTHGASVTCDM